MIFNAAPPKPYSESWRESYRYTNKDEPRFSSYQAPGGQPVPFAYKSLRIGGGQSVDTPEFPFYGYWSNSSLNEKPQQITVTGSVSGENYIKQRNALFAAVQVQTSDDSCGYLDMPLWGRFAVVVTSWDIEETNSANGKADISITFTRAGYSDENRVADNALSGRDGGISTACDKLNATVVKSFTETVAKNGDADTLTEGFSQFRKRLADIVGRVQGAKSAINDIANKVNGITNLIAQGVRTPAELAEALVSACTGVVTGVLGILSSLSSTADYFTGDNGTDTGSKSVSPASGDQDTPVTFVKNNTKNVLMNFLGAQHQSIDIEAITENQQVTKAAMENLYKAISFSVCAQLLPEIDGSTYQQQNGFWTLFERLEDSINLDDSDVYSCIEDVRIGTAQSLLAQNASVEMIKEITKETPVLALALYLGCDADRIRSLNSIADSFLIKGRVIYV